MYIHTYILKTSLLCALYDSYRSPGLFRATANRWQTLRILGFVSFIKCSSRKVAPSEATVGGSCSSWLQLPTCNFQLATCHLLLATCHFPRCSMQLRLGLASFLLINKSTDTRQSYAKRIRRMGVWA